MTKIRIAPDGIARGLWTDDIDWQSLGQIAVQRASHVEFCRRRQLWYVREVCCRNALRIALQRVLRRPLGKTLCWSTSRADALEWEAKYFGVGGPGWKDLVQ